MEAKEVLIKVKKHLEWLERMGKEESRFLNRDMINLIDTYLTENHIEDAFKTEIKQIIRKEIKKGLKKYEKDKKR